MWTLSIDIGGTYVKSALVRNTTVKEKRQVPTPQTENKSFIIFLTDLIRSYQQLTDIQAVAIAVPGAVTETGTVFFGGAVACLDKVNLKKQLEEEIELPVFVENDAKAAVLGETWYGNLKNTTNGAGIILGTGVGVGLLLEGKIRKGPHCQAGEVSFLIQDRAVQGPESFVGSHLSAVRLVKELSALLQCEEDGRQVFEMLYLSGNEAANKLYKQYCNQAAILCFNLQCLLDLEKMIIGGGISQQPQLIDDIQKSYEAIFSISPMIKQTIPKITIRAAAFQSDANLIGAAKGAEINEISN